jgi:hypothetical protein
MTSSILPAGPGVPGFPVLPFVPLVPFVPLLLTTDNVAERAPGPWGAKLIITWQLEPATTWPMQLVELIRKSPGLLPENVRADITSGADPLLATLTACGLLIVDCGWAENTTELDSHRGSGPGR